MSFATPGMFYLLFLLLPFTGLVLYAFGKKKKVLQQFLAKEAQQQLVVRSRPEVDFFRSLLLILVLILLITALARPQWGERTESLDIRGLQLVFLLDTSSSMAAEDIRPSRLEAAKTLISGCVDLLRTDLVSLINFAAVAYVQCPLTSDYEAFKLLTEASTISPAEEQGTDFASVFTLAAKNFKKSRGGQNLAILITDGEDQEKRWQEILPQLKKERIALFCVGVGAPEGAPIPIKDAEGKTVNWKLDRQGQMVKTTLEEATLARIASETGGHYFRLSESTGIREFLTLIQSYERRVLGQKTRSRKIDRFYFPLIAAIILLFLEMMLSEKKVRWKKE